MWRASKVTQKIVVQNSCKKFCVIMQIQIQIQTPDMSYFPFCVGSYVKCFEAFFKAS